MKASFPSYPILLSNSLILTAAALLGTFAAPGGAGGGPNQNAANQNQDGNAQATTLVISDPVIVNGAAMIADGRQIFRFDTFGDEVYWSGTLMLDQAIEGTQFGGVGPGLAPSNALALGCY